MDYYLRIKRNKLLVNETTWMNFKSTVLSERARYKRFTYCMILFVKHFCKGKSIGSENRSIVARIWGWATADYKNTRTYWGKWNRLWYLNRQNLWNCNFPGGSDGKEYACNSGDLGLKPRSPELRAVFTIWTTSPQDPKRVRNDLMTKQ